MPCRRSQGGGVVSQHALQVSRPTPKEEVEGSGLGGSLGPHPGGKLRGLAGGRGSPGSHLGGGISRLTPGGVSRPTPRGVSRPTPGEVLQVHTQGGFSRPTPWGDISACTEADPPSMATAAGGTHPTGMHSCSSVVLVGFK